jgi:hypothetical protein
MRDFERAERRLLGISSMLPIVGVGSGTSYPAKQRVGLVGSTRHNAEVHSDEVGVTI